MLCQCMGQKSCVKLRDVSISFVFITIVILFVVRCYKTLKKSYTLLSTGIRLDVLTDTFMDILSLSLIILICKFTDCLRTMK